MNAAAQKQVATVKARAALQGIALTESMTEGGFLEYIASKGPFTRRFETIEDVERWLDRVESKR